MRRTFLVCDQGDGGIVLNLAESPEHLLELLSDGYGAEDLADIGEWSGDAELGALYEGEYICIVRVLHTVEIPRHGEIR